MKFSLCIFIYDDFSHFLLILPIEELIAFLLRISCDLSEICVSNLLEAKQGFSIQTGNGNSDIYVLTPSHFHFTLRVSIILYSVFKKCVKEKRKEWGSVLRLLCSCILAIS